MAVPILAWFGFIKPTQSYGFAGFLVLCLVLLAGIWILLQRLNQSDISIDPNASTVTLVQHFFGFFKRRNQWTVQRFSKIVVLTGYDFQLQLELRDTQGRVPIVFGKTQQETERLGSNLAEILSLPLRHEARAKRTSGMTLGR
ncbi:MAG: hypothetical protein AAF750_04755 [Planctomycetota bacterium]